MINIQNNDWIDKIAKSISIDNNNYIVNLEWRNKQTSAGTAPRITRALAKENIPHDDIDIYFPYIGSDKMYAQIGYAIDNGFSDESKPLAASLLSARNGKWAGLFRINEKESYFIFINEDLIDPDSDILGDHDDIEIIFKQACEDNDLTKEQILIYIEDTDSGIEGLKEILSESNIKKIPRYKNININFKKVNPFFYAIPIISIILILSFFHYNEKQKEKRLALEAEKQREEMRLRRLAEIDNSMSEEEDYKKRLEEIKFKKERRFEELFNIAKDQKPKPWVDYPQSNQLFSFCTNSLKRVPLFKSTWKLRNATCDRDSITSVYVRGSSVNVDRFIEENPNAILDSTGESATFITMVNEDFNNSYDKIPENFNDYKRSRYLLIGSMQNRNVSFNIGASSFISTGSNIVSQDDHNENDEIHDSGYVNTSILGQLRNNVNNFVDNSRSNFSNQNRSNDEKEELTYKEQYENHIKEEDIEALNISDLPDNYLMKLQNIYEVDWATQQISISTPTTLDWFSNIIPDVNGLRINEIRVELGGSSQIEWRLLGNFYYREKASLQNEE